MEQPVFLSSWHQATGLSENLNKDSEPASVFENAVSSFQAALSDEDRVLLKPFKDASGLMADLVDHYLRGRLQPFFEVVGIVIQSNPEWTAVAWGALRLVFLLSSNYVSFFEKLAGMLAAMTDRLPSYHDHILRLRECCPDILKGRLGQVLSFVYADILQFCQEACKIFTKRQGGKRDKLKFVCNLFWTPFDVRFAHLLERLREHQELLEFELRTENDKAMTSFIVKMKSEMKQRDGTNDPRSRQQIEEEIAALYRKRLRDMKDKAIMSFIIKVKSEIKKREELRNDPKSRHQLEQDLAAQHKTRLRDIKFWINSSDFATVFEKSQRSRNPGSCTWILQDPAYTSWKIRTKIRTGGNDFSSDISSEVRVAQASNITTRNTPNILWLEGKPGFGKTTLSVSIIEDLRLDDDNNDVDDDSSIDDNTASVVYFHFDAQRPGKRECSDALRAITAQLVHRHQADLEVIDAVSMLMDLKGSGQLNASTNDLAAIFLLFVSRFSSLTLVLDGIDECEDFVDFFQLFPDVSLKLSFRAIFLGRPLVQIRPKYRHAISRHSLHDSNKGDIRDYLFLKVVELQESDDISDDLTPAYIVDRLASRANSMFLWAVLMASYLQCPALSPADRREEIETSNRLEEMDKLYCALLGQLDQGFTKEKALVTKIFQFLATSDQPPSIQELRIAIAIRPGRKLSESDYITNFPDALRRICGALVEINADDTVQVIHLSLREFLLSEEARKLKAPFRVELRAASLFLSATYLSHLVCDIPQGPLSGFPDVPAEIKDLRRQFPLLRFAAQSWVAHACTAIGPGPESLVDLISICEPLFQQLIAFLFHKESISAWIEACWTWLFPPSVEALRACLQARLQESGTGSQPNITEKQISASMNKIQALSEDLIKLHDEWGQLLQLRAYEIWAPSISAFMGSLSWAQNDDAKATPIESKKDGYEQNNEIIISVSKVSDCGRFVGTVKIYRPVHTKLPKAPNNCSCDMSIQACACNKRPVNLQDAIAHYQILEINANLSLADFHIELDLEDLKVVEENSDGQEFRMPVAISSDLAQISILHTVYRIGPGQELAQQKIDLSANVPSHAHRSITNPDRSWYANSEDRRDSKHWKDTKQSKFYRLEFSPCGNYLAVAKRNIDTVIKPEGFWSITIWKRENSRIDPQKSLLWQLVTGISTYGNFLVGGSFAFNPRYTLFVLMEIGKEDVPSSHERTVICDFGGEAQRAPEKMMVYGSHLANLHFSPCGRYLYGDYGSYSMVLRMVDLKRFLNGTTIILPPDASTPDFYQLPTATSLIQTKKSLVNSTNELKITFRNGVPGLSTIRKYSDGALVQKRLTSKTEEEKALLYLPASIHQNSSVSVLDNPEGEQDHIRMVMVNNPQESYRLGNPRNANPPVMITRLVKSIRDYKLPSGRHNITFQPNELSNVPLSYGSKLLADAESQ